MKQLASESRGKDELSKQLVRFPSGDTPVTRLFKEMRPSKIIIKCPDICWPHDASLWSRVHQSYISSFVLCRKENYNQNLQFTHICVFQEGYYLNIWLSDSSYFQHCNFFLTNKFSDIWRMYVLLVWPPFSSALSFHSLQRLPSWLLSWCSYATSSTVSLFYSSLYVFFGTRSSLVLSTCPAHFKWLSHSIL